jgi:hypothetical protein
MFLTNSMLSSKGIANGPLGVITDILHNGDIEAAFRTEEGIQVRWRKRNGSRWVLAASTFTSSNIRTASLHCNFDLPISGLI